MATTNEKTQGINRDVPQTGDLLAFLDGIVNDELLMRLKLAMAMGLTSQAWGIFAETDPADEDGSDTTAPLIVLVNEDSVTSVDVYPGTVVTKLGLWAVISEVISVELADTDTGAENVVYFEYQNEETDLRGVRSRTTSIASKRVIKADAELIKVATLTDYQDFDTATLNRCVPLALVTRKATTTTDETVVDMSQDTFSDNRPWFSVVDIAHRKQLGSGTPSVSNPHGMTANDFQVAGDLSLYDALIGRGLVLGPEASHQGVPGTACVETIPASRWETDTDGSVTGSAGAEYVRLLGYPVALGACELQDGNEGTTSADLLAIKRVPKTNIIYITSFDLRTIVIPGPDGEDITIVLSENALTTGIYVTLEQSGANAISYSSGVLTINWLASGINTSGMVSALDSALSSESDFESVDGSGSTTWTTDNMADNDGDYKAVADDAEWLLYYTCVKALEPPTDFSNESTLTFGEPTGKEAYIADGLAFNTVATPTLDLERLGPAPRRIRVFYSAEEGLLTDPQILLTYQKLDDFEDDEEVIEQTFIGPGRVRIWLIGATPGASLNIEIGLQGTDRDGSSLSETITFGSSWVDNAGGSDTEEPNQAQISDGYFAGDELTVTIDTRENDGPFSAVIIEVVPDFVNESTSNDRGLYVCEFMWDGFHAIDMRDEREVVANLKKAGRPRWERMGQMILGAHAIWPANEHVAVLSLGDDSERMEASDQILTRRTGQRPYMAPNDTTLTSDDREGNDAWYYSRAEYASDLMEFVQVIVTGDDNVDDPDVEFRWTTSEFPDLWSSWVQLDAGTYINTRKNGNTGTAMSFFSHLPDETGFGSSDTVWKWQLRIRGRWWSYVVITSDDNLHEQTADALITSLNDLFDVEHYGEGNSILSGRHRNILLFPDQSLYKLFIAAHEDDEDNPDNKSISMIGWHDGDMAFSEIFFVTAEGEIWAYKGWAGDLPVSGDLNLVGDANIGGDATADAFVYNASTDKYTTVPIEGLGMVEVISESYEGSFQVPGYDILATPGDIWSLPDFFNVLACASANWELFFSLDPYIQHGATIKEIRVLMAMTGGGGTQVVVGRLLTKTAVGTSTSTFSQLEFASDIMSDAGSGVRQREWLIFDMDDSLVSLDTNCYCFHMYHSAGNAVCQILRIDVVTTADDVQTLLDLNTRSYS